MNPISSSISIRKSSLTIDSHERLSDQGLLVYPVLSRRSGGVSIGINLNPDKICNFGCVYCQVNRTEQYPHPKVDIETVAAQLEWFLGKVKENHGIWEEHPVKDIAFSGDGEPTTYPEFHKLLKKVIHIRNDMGLHDLRLILITNASRFHIPKVYDSLSLFFEEGGCVWAKLDAGDEENYHQLMRSKIPFRRILDNIKRVGQSYPITLQSCFMRVNQQTFGLELLASYIKKVQSLLDQGTQVEEIQAYTIARPPAESIIAAWPDSIMDVIQHHLESCLNTPVRVYYGKIFS